MDTNVMSRQMGGAGGMELCTVGWVAYDGGESYGRSGEPHLHV